MDLNIYPLLNLASSSLKSPDQAEFILNNSQINTIISIILTLNLSSTQQISVNCHQLPLGQHAESKLCLFITNPITDSNFVAVTYSPQLFKQIRLLSGVTENDMQASFGFARLLEKIIRGDLDDLKGSSSAGRSNSLFYYSFDKRFIVRTICRNEYCLLKEILPSYFEYIQQNPHSYITRFYEFSKLRLMNGGEIKKVYYVVMNNVFYNTRSIHTCYDIKGSFYGRSSQQKSADKPIVYKDQDLLESGQQIRLRQPYLNLILDQITRDSHFLSSIGLIDYSLILGVHNISSEEEGSVTRNELSSPDNKEIYYMGIIDILTRYNTFKKFEYAFKGGVFGYDQISCNPPDKYQQRFIEFLHRVFW
jgi:1-phosphatidylinositol-4-phosphate 5-kinase